ncbi:hypothetical protein V5E97_03350 [Singulisphaera sp. Ch08]|uniref:Uncharacterized protein n=1 Tax=Singulisphaera sp. Ch08 TaxID=3120278 RepID=A0AAU7CIH3_9BACT
MGKRSFNSLDALILGVSAAIGVWLARRLLVSDFVAFPVANHDAWSTLIGSSYPVLLVMSIGVVILRFRQPRPSIRRLSRQPGFLASVAILSMTVFGTVLAVIDWATFWGNVSLGLTGNWLRTSLISLVGPWNVGFMVLMAWLIGGLQGFRWRDDWVERAGRLVGGLWIALWMFFLGLKLWST